MRYDLAMRSAWMVLALAISGCTPGEVGLHVDLKTDLVPSVEFVSVRTRVDSAGDAQRRLGDTTMPADRADDARYEGGVRVAELAVPAGMVQITVELLDRTSEVVGGTARSVMPETGKTRSGASQNEREADDEVPSDA